MAMSRSPSDFAPERARMVAEQLKARGIHDSAVLAAMRVLPRHLFVDESLAARAYDDMPLPIGDEQTISQPYMVALMTQVLAPKPGERLLEIGTGSGYQTALLAGFGAHVLSLERIPALATRARALLEAFGLGDRVTVKVADGTLGWPDEAPYDGIIVTAGAPVIPRPLVEQLAPAGRLVLPMGEEELQTLVRIRRAAAGGFVEEYFGECRFVKLRGMYGWEEP
jgi:protein-L-isoaspartate(D-aspartate) O-methyltransferase